MSSGRFARYPEGMSATARALVLRTAGTNCDAEMCRAFELAGARVDLVHLDRLCARPEHLDAYDLIGFPGGFSYGDDIASGRIFAAKVRRYLWPALVRAVVRGVPMLGVCNGFQVMVQSGLLPGPEPGADWPDEPPTPSIGLARNDSARFLDRWVGVAVEPASPCIWTADLDPSAAADVMKLPVANGEGRIVTDDAEGLARTARVALRYTEPVNGSTADIAGVCDASGRLFGLMPHPDRYLSWTHHPFWTRLDDSAKAGDTPGLAMFRSAVVAAGALHV